MLKNLEGCSWFFYNEETEQSIIVEKNGEYWLVAWSPAEYNEIHTKYCITDGCPPGTTEADFTFY